MASCWRYNIRITAVSTTMLLMALLLTACISDVRSEEMSSTAIPESPDAMNSGDSGGATVATDVSATIAPTPHATPAIDLQQRASQPAFPDAEIVHVLSIEEPYNEPHNPDHTSPMTVETWIDQTSGDVVVRRVDDEGQLRTLTVKQGLTVTEYRADAVQTMLRVIRAQSLDDRNLPNPTSHLDLFESYLERSPDEIEQQGGEIDQDASFEGQPAIKVVVPFGDQGQALGEMTAYLNPDTLYPLAIVGQDGRGQKFSYPTIETIDRDDVPENTFDPDIPDADYRYLQENFSIGEAEQFSAYPIWWLGDAFSGYTRGWIDHFQSESPTGTIGDRDEVVLTYFADLENVNESEPVRIISQGLLSDQEWAARDANHQAQGLAEIEIQGHRAWLHPSDGYVEIDFPGSYVSVSAPTQELALDAAQALTKMNPDALQDGSS